MQKAIYSVSEKLYKAAAQAQQSQQSGANSSSSTEGTGSNAAGGDGVVDVDYTDVDDESLVNCDFWGRWCGLIKKIKKFEIKKGLGAI